MSIKYAKWNKKAVAYIKNSYNSWLSVAEGGIRAGKNVLQIMIFCIRLEKHPNRYHAAAGATMASAKNNIIDCNEFGIEHFFKGRCRRGICNNKDCLYVNTLAGEKVVFITGLLNIASIAPIKGFTLGMVMVTEANECQQEALMTLLDRTLGSDDRLCLLDLNPKMPKHWFYTNFLDKQEEKYDDGKTYELNHQRFTIFDNMSYSNEKIKKRLESYDKNSARYKSIILGERISSDGRIYDFSEFSMTCGYNDLDEAHFINFCIGADVGIGSSATTSILVGFTEDYRQVYVMDAYYEKQGENKSHNEDYFANKTALAIKDWGTKDRRIGNCYVFSDYGLFFIKQLATEMDKMGLDSNRLNGAHKLTINKRIELVKQLMDSGRIKINRESPGLQPLIEAFYSAKWDSKELEKGKQVRVDDGSYSVDSLDALEYALTYYMNRLIG